MVNQMGIFDPKYPNVAGHKDDETSREAALAIEESSCAGAIREKILALWEIDGKLKIWEPRMPDQIAEDIGVNIHSTRSRISELIGQGKLFKTGIKGKSSFGKPQGYVARVI